MYYRTFVPFNMKFLTYDKLKFLIWKIIYYGGLFVCAKFHGQIIVLFSPFFTL